MIQTIAFAFNYQHQPCIGMFLGGYSREKINWLFENKYFDADQYQNYSAENFRFAFKPGAAASANENTGPAEGESYCSDDEAGDIRVRIQ